MAETMQNETPHTENDLWVDNHSGTTGYSTFSVHERMVETLNAARIHGIKREFAVAITALSEGETGAYWLQNGPPTLDRLHEDDDIGCPTVIVGIELGAFDTTLRKSPKTLAFLQEHSLVGTNDQGKLIAVNGFGNPVRQDIARRVFEYTVAEREGPALRLYSIGATQMHLYWTGLADPTKKRRYWPSTWEEIWAAYQPTIDVSKLDTSRSGGDVNIATTRAKVAHLMDLWGTYLKTVEDGGLTSKYPGPPFDDEVAIQWLIWQAGNRYVAEAANYGNAKLLGARRPYRDVWPEAWAISEDVWGTTHV